LSLQVGSVIELVVTLVVLGLIFYFLTGVWARRGFSANGKQNQKQPQKRVQRTLSYQRSVGLTWDQIGGYNDVKKEIREYIAAP